VAPSGGSRHLPVGPTSGDKAQSSGQHARRAVASRGAASSLGAHFSRTRQARASNRDAKTSCCARVHRHRSPLEAIGRDIPLPIPVPDWSKPVIAALVLLTAALAMRSRLVARRAHRLGRQRNELLRDTRVMQGALVPEVPASIGTLAVSVAYRPADGPAAGGDFYDVFELGAGRVAMILGDVSGHGQEALREAALTRYTIRAYLLAGLGPRTALALGGRALARPRVERFATVAVAVYDRRGSELTYALAGHPPPIFRRVGAPEPLTICCSPPVGLSYPTGRRQSKITLPPGSEVCFFTDGLEEARAEGGLLGREGLSVLLDRTGPHASAREVLERIQEQTDATRDDMAVCILAPTTTEAVQLVHTEELEAEARELCGESVQRFLQECDVDKAQSLRVRRLALDIAGASGTAVIRVEAGPDGIIANAVAPPPSQMTRSDQEPDEERAVRPAGRPDAPQRRAADVRSRDALAPAG